MVSREVQPTASQDLASFLVDVNLRGTSNA
jgi:hypothetical protein